jgi:hypothetical protein
MYPLFVIFFSLFCLAFGLYLYVRRSGAASLIGSILSVAGLVFALIAAVAWLLPGFFSNIS